jgi:glycosyltransferase involved in cell wall biosynthesis
MKLLLITPFPPTIAPEVDHAVCLCNKLAAAGVDVHVLTGKQSKTITYPRVTVHPDLGSWSWSSLPNLALRLRLCKPDVVMLMYLFWTYNSHPMMTFVPTVSKKLLPRTRFVTLFEDHWGVDPRNTFDGTSYVASSRLDRWIHSAVSRFSGLAAPDFSADADYGHGDLGTLLRDSDHLIVVSERERKILMARLPCVSSKSTVIPAPSLIRILPEDEGRVRRASRERLGIAPEEFVLAYFGYTYLGKGIETLLRALPLVSRGKQKVRLLLVGGTLKFSKPRYTEELHELVTQLGIDQEVIWTGGYPAESDDASRYLRAADACVLPFDSGVSIHNSSLAAAVTHGMPVITTRGDDLEAAFVDGENVLLCPPKDPEAMARLIEILIDRPELQRRLRTGALAMAREWFSWDKAVERTIAACSRGGHYR